MPRWKNGVSQHRELFEVVVGTDSRGAGWGTYPMHCNGHLATFSILLIQMTFVLEQTIAQAYFGDTLSDFIGGSLALRIKVVVLVI